MRSACFMPVLSVLLIAVIAASPAGAGVFRDPKDGAFDMSEYLLDRVGLFPVPIVITEPAVGYGGGLGLVFFRQSVRDRAEHASGRRVPPPDMYALGMFATENGTQGQGGGAKLSFAEDRWRYRGIVGRLKLNVTFYGSTPGSGLDDLAFDSSIRGWTTTQQLLRRIGTTNQFVGARLIYLDWDSHVETPGALPNVDPLESSIVNSGLGASWELDSRDNIFTPSRGAFAGVSSMFYDDAFGSDDVFQTYRANLYGYVPCGRALVVGLRADSRFARGDVPYFQYPYIELRGIQAARYQGANVAVAETELRWNLTSRWALIGFGGAGKAWGSIIGFDDATTHGAGGAGFRYLCARQLGMYAGLDMGWGPEENAIYIQVGSAWH